MIISPDEAVTRLNNGQVVALPTETVYGLAARIDRPEALKKVFSVKKRPLFDPLIVHVANPMQAASLVKEWPPVVVFLTRHFWPGPLTVVLPKSDAVNPLITAGLETVAIRWPKHPVLQKILDQIGVPLAAPSANRFGKTSPTAAEHVEMEFSSEVGVVDGGPCDIGLESTVIEFNSSDQIALLRAGGVSASELEAALKKFDSKIQLIRKSSAASPGQLKEHYQPDVPLVLLDTSSLPDSTALAAIADKLGRPHSWLELKLPEDPRLAARMLYSEMRRLAQENPGLLLFCTQPYFELPDWDAIADRLTRASTRKCQAVFTDTARP